ncbi:unnamed protein product, partial [Symbiodinium necroappetens]
LGSKRASSTSRSGSKQSTAGKQSLQRVSSKLRKGSKEKRPGHIRPKCDILLHVKPPLAEGSVFYRSANGCFLTSERIAPKAIVAVTIRETQERVEMQVRAELTWQHHDWCIHKVASADPEFDKQFFAE